MRCIFIKIHSRRNILYMLLTLFVFLLFACGQGTNIPQATSPDTCTITFDISWPESARENTFSRLKLDCGRIPNIMANVYSESGKLLRKGGPWECSTGKGIITDVPSGGKAIVTIQGMDPNENIIYRGESNLIDLVPGTVSAGTIEAHNFIPELKSPPDNSNVMIKDCVFQWGEVQGASKYQIQIAGDDSFTNLLIDTDLSTLSYTPSENLPTGICHWRVRTKGIYGEVSGWSDKWSVIILDESALITDYYVDASNGNDSTGDGSQTNPWMTITHALEQINGPEVTIHVAKGTYDTIMDGTSSEVFPINLKDGVSLKGEDKDTTIIDANKTNTLITGTDIGSETTIEDFTFINGKYTGSGGPGGIVLTNSSPTIKNNIFEDNEGWSQGAILSLYSSSSPHILNNTFKNNVSEYHGTIYISSSSPIIGENLFTGNSAGRENVEAVIYIASGTALIRNNIFANNNTYGCITIASGSNNSHIVNNTITGTDPNNKIGSGIIISGGTGTKIVNNIISDNSGYGIEEKDASSDSNIVEYNLFCNNKSGHFFDEGTTSYTTVLSMNGIISECSNNLEADPLFVDQSMGDYHLQGASNAINAGTNNNAPVIDIDGDVRPQDGIVDIGADETKITPPGNIIAFPADGRITITWDAVSAATAYNIYMVNPNSISKADYYEEKQNVNTTYYTWIGLDNGTAYSFVLTSLNSLNDESYDSNTIVATPDVEQNYYIFPYSGTDSAPTEVMIIGKDFQETTTISLYGGGPYITGTCDTPGSAEGVYVAGNYAFVADGDLGLQIIDIGNPNAPSIKGSCDTPGSAQDVYVLGNYAYVADGESGLQVIDISEPNKPFIIGSCDTPGSAQDVYVVGNFAYVANEESGVQVIDVSDSNKPDIIGSCDTPGSAQDVYVLGNYAYVADGESGLQVIDISEPNKPSIIGFFDTSGYASGVYVAGNYAYMADSSGLQVIDISDPNYLSGIGYCDIPGSAHAVYVAGKFAYVAAWFEGLQVIDISDPNNPSIIGSCYTPNPARGVHVAGNFAYLSDANSGLRVIDISKPNNLYSSIGSFDTPDVAGAVYVLDNYAYVADGYSGLLVIDINDPNKPSQIGSCYTPTGSAIDVYVSGKFAYVANGSGLQVIDISKPYKPYIIDSCNTPGYAYGVYVAGKFAYVAACDSGLQVIDISDPNYLSGIGFLNTSGCAFDVYIASNYAYVADGDSGLLVIDISDPNKPSSIGYCDTPGLALDVYISGNYAYIADRSGLQVIDISDPNKPSSIGYCDTGSAWSVYISGNYAYVAAWSTGLQVIDISVPKNPSILGSFDTPGLAKSAYVVGNYAYIADDRLGLQVIEIEKFKSINDITCLDSYIIKATVPAGYSPGNYNLHITDPDGEHTILHNAFTVYHLP